jgi:hypothetical protein
MLALGARWVPILGAEPETGMGYQVATVHLEDGRVFDRVVIVGGAITSIRGESRIPFDESEIRRIVVTHDKPD